MSTNKTNTTPLWRELNERRAGGKWYAEKDSNIVKTVIPGQSISAPVRVVTANCTNSKNVLDVGNPEVAKANAQYTALAVNNLHKLAEALEKASEFLEKDEMMIICADAGNKNALWHARAALAAIS